MLVHAVVFHLQLPEKWPTCQSPSAGHREKKTEYTRNLPSDIRTILLSGLRGYRSVGT